MKNNSKKQMLIEEARKDPEVLMFCRHEYVGDNGYPPPEDWEPSDEEILAVLDRISPF